MTSGIGIFKADTGEIIGIDIDLRMAEIHNTESVVTNQPIEDGSIISDHIILQPRTVEITAEMSNFDGNDSQSIGERAKTAWLEFVRQLQSRSLFDLLTHHELYKDMALESISGEHSAPFRGRLGLTLSFRQVDKTQLGIVAIPETQLAAEIKKQGSSQVEDGRQVPDRTGAQAGIDIIQNALTSGDAR